MSEFLRAVLVGGVPVALFTFLVVQWSISSGRLERLADSGNLQDQHRHRAKEAKQRQGPRGRLSLADRLHGKVLSFGGGYYGTMAVLTYVLIECVEVWQFLLRLLDPGTWANRLGLDLLIEFLVNSVTNLVAAFVWFITLPDYISMHDGWIWLGVSYAGYWLALKVTVVAGDSLWERLAGLLKRRD